jgi:hypothetical protein
MPAAQRPTGPTGASRDPRPDLRPLPPWWVKHVVDVDYTIPNAAWRPGNTALSTSCGVRSSVALRQVLDIGNGDTYTQDLPGQSFDITDLPNGTYHVEVAANPENRLQESNTANNIAHRTVILDGVPGARTVTVPPLPGLEG